MNRRSILKALAVLPSICVSMTLGEYLLFVLHHPDCDVNLLAKWFYRYEPIEDEI